MIVGSREVSDTPGWEVGCSIYVELMAIRIVIGINRYF